MPIISIIYSCSHMADLMTSVDVSEFVASVGSQSAERTGWIYFYFKVIVVAAGAILLSSARRSWSGTNLLTGFSAMICIETSTERGTSTGRDAMERSWTLRIEVERSYLENRARSVTSQRSTLASSCRISALGTAPSREAMPYSCSLNSRTRKGSVESAATRLPIRFFRQTKGRWSFPTSEVGYCVRRNKCGREVAFLPHSS